MTTEEDWFHRRKEPAEEELLEQAKGCIDAYCDAEFGSDAEVEDVYKRQEPMSGTCGKRCIPKSSSGAGNTTGNRKTKKWNDKEV